MTPELAAWLQLIDDKRRVVSRTILERVIVELRKMLEERVESCPKCGHTRGDK